VKANVLLLPIFLASSATSQTLDIGILRNNAVETVEISLTDASHFSLRCDTTVLTPGAIFKVSRDEEKISATTGGRTFESFDSLYLESNSETSLFSLQNGSLVGSKIRKYRGGLLITVAGGKLKLINRVSVENYVSGVIESEGGAGKHIEYYKVQAIISRTYALEHLDKHNEEGFHLCDGVHCQAYLNFSLPTADMIRAVKETKGLVLVTSSGEMAKCFFHANCGGQTSAADFVWNEEVAYCKSVRDTFCTRSKQANWTKRIPFDDWRNFLSVEYGFPTVDSLLGPLLFWYDQTNRDAFFIHPMFGIPLRDLRTKFDLKSTWFSVRPEGNEVVLTGHGFGHGVGLCQEGAMRMATLGFSSGQILNFYFTGLKLMDYSDWKFFGFSETVWGEL